MSTLRVSSVSEVLAEAQRLCGANPALLRQEIAATNNNTKRAARQFVATLSMTAKKPLGVQLLERKAKEQQTNDETFDLATLGTTKTSTGDHQGQQHQQEPQDATMTSAAMSLKAPVPKSSLSECPYCTAPHTRFCAESGRRHETSEERGRRLWRTAYKQILFSNKMQSMTKRLEKENTCAEEFCVEIF